DARVQQASWESARTWLEARRSDVASCREGLRRLADSALHADARLGGLPDDLARLERLLAAVDVSLAPKAGLETLLAAVVDAEQRVAAAGAVAGAARFCRAGLDDLTAAAAYLLDPALAIPGEPRYEGLRTAREEALALAAQALPLAAEDRAGDALTAAEQF